MNTKHHTSIRNTNLTGISLLISVTLLISLLQPVLAAAGQPASGQERQSQAGSGSTGDSEKVQDQITTEGSGVFAAENTARRLEFSKAGLRYLPKLNQTREVDFRYRLTSILAQGDAEFSEETQRAVRPKRNGNEVYYFRSDALVEKYRTIEDGVEQSFILQQSVETADQDVVLRGEVGTGLRAEATTLRSLSGVAYMEGHQPIIHYGSPTVTDAAGRETATELRLEGGQLDLVIDASWLREAVYPVTVRASIRSYSRPSDWTLNDSMMTSAVASIEDSQVWRVQLRVQTADVSNAGTDDFVRAQLNSGNSTWLDYGRDDFERADAFTYDLVLDNVRKLSDITMLSLSKVGSNGWCVRSIVLYVNGKAIFSRDFGSAGRWLDNDGYDHRSVTIPSLSLRSTSSWSSYLLPAPPLSFSRWELESRIETIVAQFLQGCSVDWGPIYGRAVEVTRKDNRTIHVDLDLGRVIPWSPDQEFDVDFEIQFSCASGKLFLTTSDIGYVNFGGTLYDLQLTLQFIEYLTRLSERVEASLQTFTYTRYGAPACPAISVLSDGSVSIVL